MSSSNFTKEEAWRNAIYKAQDGDKRMRDMLITENVGLIYMVLKRFSNRGTEQEDLFQIGVIGLIKAIDKFDLSLNLSFSTYAVPMIIGEIRRFLRDDGMIHISRQIKDNARKIAVIKENWKKNYNCEPTISDLEKETGLSAEEIVTAVEATMDVESIYKPIGTNKEEGNLVLADQIEDEKKTEQDLINQITVRQILEQLGEKERILIQMRYLEGKTQTEIAHRLDMNQVAVSRLEKRILLRLRNQF